MRYFKYTLVVAFSATLILASCSDSEHITSGPPTSPGIGMGTVSGTVEFWSGDFMPTFPGDDRTGTVEKVSRKLFLFERALLARDVTLSDEGDPTFYESINTQLIAISESDANGEFSIIAPPGHYTLVVEENGLFYANSFDGDGAVFPVDVTDDNNVSVVFEITYMATF